MLTVAITGFFEVEILPFVKSVLRSSNPFHLSNLMFVDIDFNIVQNR